MDVSKIYFLNEYYILENLTVRLVEMDKSTGYKLMLASEINHPSEKLYEIKIKQTYFSNGEPVTLIDVRDSLLRAKDSKNSHVAFADIVDSINIKNDVLQIHLKKKVLDFFYYLTLADLSILHSSQLGKNELMAEDWVAVTSGPFSYFLEDKDAYLIKNPHYKLGSLDYPDRVKLISARDKDTFEDFQNDLIDIGEFNLSSFEKNIDKLDNKKNLKVIGNNGDMITFMALNAERPMFKNPKVRKWIQKKIILGFDVDSKYNNVARKALQFFTPQVKGFVSENEIIKKIEFWKDIDTNVIPLELKNGIVINTYQRAYEATLKGVLDNLSSVLGIPVKINTNVPSPEFASYINKKDYDVFLGITSMDQVIVGESINLYYFSSFPLFKDVNKEISKLMNIYHQSEPMDSVRVLNTISLQMIEDSECIPLFYVASPFFFNNDKFDVSGLDEMTYFNLWKLKKF